MDIPDRLVELDIDHLSTLPAGQALMFTLFNCLSAQSSKMCISVSCVIGKKYFSETLDPFLRTETPNLLQVSCWNLKF